MKTRVLLLAAICFMPTLSNAAIPYRVEQVSVPEQPGKTGVDNQSLASQNRYIGGFYDFSMWNRISDENVSFDGKDTSSFDGVLGVRLSDTWRLEGNYIRTDADWGDFSLAGDTAMLNMIFDARIDNLYRPFRHQRLVPYVGFGGGASWVSGDGVSVENKINPVAGALAGVGVELGENFALDFGYRYFYMFNPRFDIVSGVSPTAHQFRAGFRINF